MSINQVEDNSPGEVVYDQPMQDENGLMQMESVCMNCYKSVIVCNNKTLYFRKVMLHYTLYIQYSGSNEANAYQNTILPRRDNFIIQL